MKRKLIHRIVLFIVLLLAINFLLDGFYKVFVVHNTINHKKDQQFEAYTDSLVYLSMGNSHNAVNTYILPLSFNYGSPGESYIQSYYKLKYIIENTDKKPQNLLIFPDITSFSPKLSGRLKYNSYWIKYIDYYELARIKEKPFLLSKMLQGKYFSYAGNYKDLQLSILYHFLIKKEKDSIIEGDVVNTNKEISTEEKDKKARSELQQFFSYLRDQDDARLKMHNGYRPHRDYKNWAEEKDKLPRARWKSRLFLERGEATDQYLLFYFERILRLCEENAIGVYLIRTPISTEFYHAAGEVIDIEGLYHTIDSISGQYSTIKGVYDFHDAYVQHPEYFFDAHHLNPVGADRFTEMLKAKIESGKAD